MNTITLIPMGGLANRLRSIASGINLAKDCNSKLKIIWFKTWEIGCRFDQLFNPINSEMIELKEASFLDLILFDRPRKKNFFIPGVFHKLLFEKYFHENTKTIACSFDYHTWAKGHNVCIISCYEFYEKDGINGFENFTPISVIQKKIDEVAQKFPPNIIGVHIRRTDNRFSISNSPTELFIEKMKEEKDSSFYLASDLIQEKQNIISLFKDKIYCYDCIIERGTVEGIKNAVIELFLLSKTKKIYGSCSSSFGEIAAKIGKIEFKELQS